MKTINYTMANNYLPSQKTLSIYNPTSNTIFATVPALSTADIDYAYKSATAAKASWSKLTISERAEYLHKWSQLILDNQQSLANILVSEIAKNYNDSIIEVQRTAEYIEYTIEEMYRIELTARSSEQYYGQQANKVAITKRIPLGVVLAISPFNYPINLAISKIAPALISGNTVVFKPATQGSVAATMLYNLFKQTGAPEGVLNLVTGRGSEIGDYLVSSNKADMISFTGGTAIGTNLSKLSIMTPHVLELGGKDAAIILDEDNLDLDFITDDIISGAFSYSGQRCTAIKRVLVPHSLAAQIERLLTLKLEKLIVGKPQDNANITPVIDSKSADYIQSLIEDATSKGAILLTPFIRNHNLLSPVLVTNVTEDMDIYYQEPFGPALPIITYDNIEEAIAIHNDSDYGLQVSVYGNDINSIFAISDKLDVGSVNINGKTSRGPDNFTFTGFKQSGLGVQGINDSIMSMTKPKTIVINT